MLIIAEVLFIKFGLAFILSVILLTAEITAFRFSGFKFYEIVAIMIVINTLVIGAIIVKESGIVPRIEFDGMYK